MPFLSFDAVCMGSPVIIILFYKKVKWSLNEVNDGTKTLASGRKIRHKRPQKGSDVEPFHPRTGERMTTRKI